MSLPVAAAAACGLALALAIPAHAGTVLTLEDAWARTSRQHPDLAGFEPRTRELEAAAEIAALPPALEAGLSLENALGSGEAAGLHRAELTLSLASVLERGGKRAARGALAGAELGALPSERDARRLDILAEVARRYLAAAAADAEAALAATDAGQRAEQAILAEHRHRSGASPESVVLGAQAALAQAQLDEARAQQRARAARLALAALWGGRETDLELAAGDVLALPAIEDFATLAAGLEASPELLRFASRERIAEARLQLARSEARADLGWEVGVRRLQASRDTALIASVSMPLGAGHRAAPAIRAADAALETLALEREAAALSLHATLAQAHGRYTVARLEVRRIGSDVLPRLERAGDAARRAWTAGAASHLEWTALQSEAVAARQRQLAAAVDARIALIEIQRLTARALTLTPNGETLP